MKLRQATLSLDLSPGFDSFVGRLISGPAKQGEVRVWPCQVNTDDKMFGFVRRVIRRQKTGTAIVRRLAVKIYDRVLTKY